MKRKDFWKGFGVALALVVVLNLAWKPICRAIPWHLLPFEISMSKDAKVDMIQSYLDKYYVEDIDQGKLEDTLFAGMLAGVGDKYTYYMPKENLLEHSVTQIEIFDTLFAFFAGLMIIPVVIAFNGGDPSQVNSGPSLMFISLPMVFDSMKFGTVIGAVFFLLVLFAALTSSIALMETLASVIMDKFKLKRIPATLIIIAICLVVGMLSCLGYGPWESVTIIGMQFLDFFDFISNSVLMPIVAVLTCVLIGHVVGTRVVADEVKSGAGSFHREKLHRVMIRWIAPILLVAILASELASKIFGVFSI